MKINYVIPAAGAASRLKPLSNNTSKAMVRVNGRPAIDYILSEIYRHGNVGEVVIVDGEFNDIRQYVNTKFPEVHFIKQGSLNGPRDAIRVGISKIKEKNTPLVVWLGDAIILDKDLPLGSNFLLCKEVQDHSSWCMWDGTKFYDKPAKTIQDGVALVGLYSFYNGSDAALYFTRSESYDISDVLSIYSDDLTTHTFAKVMTNRWYDIGELSTYYKTSAELLNMKARSFNSFTYNSEKNTLTKTPNWTQEHAVEAVLAEKSWYEGLTEDQKLFTPRYVPTGKSAVLELSYESGTLLSDLLLYDNITESSWDYILSKLFVIITKYFHTTSNLGYFNQHLIKLWYDKSDKRLDDLRRSHKDMTSTMAMKLLGFTYKIRAKSIPVACMHGDLHFGNILYNTNNDHLTLIDPRGMFGNHPGTEGDALYDWAKLAHDLYFGYSAIVANLEHPEFIKKMFIKKLEEYNLPVQEILMGGLVLIATCIPLHSDDPARQERLMNVVKTEIDRF
jgi:dTDP-glucose pyrophosphorylase